MARKGLSGQLNMFDFFRELEASSPQAGELEMVSLMPVEEPEIEEVKIEKASLKTKKNSIRTRTTSVENDENELRPTMQRTYQTAEGVIEIAYINYNKVRITELGKEPQLRSFESSKDAVNFYVDEMQRLEELYGDEEKE